MPLARNLEFAPVNKFTCDCSLSFVFLSFFWFFARLFVSLSPVKDKKPNIIPYNEFQ